MFLTLVRTCSVIDRCFWAIFISLASLFFLFAEKLKIITPLKDTEAKEGQEVVLNCEVNTEGAKAKWLKNEETLFESSKYVMVQRDNVFSLRIKDAQRGDEANYSITLTNQRGEQAKSSCGLNVKGQSLSVMHVTRRSTVVTQLLLGRDKMKIQQ